MSIYIVNSAGDPTANPIPDENLSLLRAATKIGNASDNIFLGAGLTTSFGVLGAGIGLALMVTGVGAPLIGTVGFSLLMTGLAIFGLGLVIGAIANYISKKEVTQQKQLMQPSTDRQISTKILPLDKDEYNALSKYVFDSDPLNFDLINGVKLIDEEYYLDMHLKSIFEKGKKQKNNFQGKFYRGMTDIKKTSFIVDANVGDIVEAPYYLSTSDDIKVASRFTTYGQKESARHNIILEIDGSSGLKLLKKDGLSFRESESETLFNKGTKFRIISDNIVKHAEGGIVQTKIGLIDKSKWYRHIHVCEVNE